MVHVAMHHPGVGPAARPGRGLNMKNSRRPHGFDADYTASFNPVNLHPDCGQTDFVSGSYLNWKILWLLIELMHWMVSIFL